MNSTYYDYKIFLTEKQLFAFTCVFFSVKHLFYIMLNIK